MIPTSLLPPSLWTPGCSVLRLHNTHGLFSIPMQGFHILNCSYPPSFVSSSSDEPFARLSLVSRDALAKCIRRFRKSIPQGYRTKADYIDLIRDDFAEQTIQLMKLSTPDLLRSVLLPTGCLTPRLSLVCLFIHNQYGAVIASQLLSSQTCWKPPELAGNGIPSPAWFQTPVTQLRSRLAKVDSGVIKDCCTVYLAPDPTPKSKTGRYDLIIERFRTRLLYLLSLSDVDFLKEYIALLPESLLDPTLPWSQLVEVLLGQEFGDMISKSLMLLPTSELKKERNKQARCEKHEVAVSNAHETQEAYIQSWPQVVQKDIVHKCLGSYYKGSQWTTLPVCCVCLRRQHDIEMHDIVVPANEELPGYLSILHSDNESLHPDDEPQFVDPRLNGLLLDPDGLQVNEEHTTLHVCSPCNGYLPRSLMPRYALANKLYRGCLPKEFQDLTWIEERVCAKYSNTAVVTRIYQSSDPSQPTVFHGNTCTHEMNVGSTAAVLPHAPPDVNGLLSVVFIGPSKFKPKYLGNMYRIWKAKVWGFLQWLKTHNKLYCDIPLDKQTMDLYPNDDYLPGIEDAIVHDN